MFSDHALATRLELTEGRGNAAFVEIQARLEPASGATWQEFGGTLAMFSGVGSPLTQTFGLGLTSTLTDPDLDAIEAFFKARGADVVHEVSPLAASGCWPAPARCRKAGDRAHRRRCSNGGSGASRPKGVTLP